MRFATFPSVLVIHAKKFQLVNWVPTKLGELLYHPVPTPLVPSCVFHLTEWIWDMTDIPLIMPPADEVTLDEYVGTGIQPGEEELPDDDDAVAPAGTYGVHHYHPIAFFI